MESEAREGQLADQRMQITDMMWLSRVPIRVEDGGGARGH